MPQTPAGEQFVKLVEEHAPFVAERADEHDRKATFPFEAFDAFHESGLLRDSAVDVSRVFQFAAVSILIAAGLLYCVKPQATANL